MNEIWQWILNFTGVNNGDNSFGTHMYNFWSGFGGNVSLLALIGVLLAMYKRSTKALKNIHVVDVVKSPLNLVHKTDQSSKPTDSK